MDRYFKRLFLLMAIFGAAHATADEAPSEGPPLLELGLGVGGVAFPHYRGSDEYYTLASPLPLVIYRGDIIKVSRGGARAELIDHPRLEINLSGGGTPPVDSDDDDNRDGMPDLDATGEFGPTISWLFSDPDDKERFAFKLEVPVRAVVASDLSDYEFLDWIVHPQLQLRTRWNTAPRRSFAVTASAGPVFASNDYHDYFYSVSPRFATPDRRAYEADAGYGGFEFSAGVFHRRDKWRVGAYSSVDLLDGATFDDSPLVADDTAWVVGLFVARSLWSSERRAEEELEE